MADNTSGIESGVTKALADLAHIKVSVHLWAVVLLVVIVVGTTLL